MASTIYTGNVQNGNLTHTNSSGKNERILIYYMHVQSPNGHACSMSVGGSGGSIGWTLIGGSNTSEQWFGINLSFNVHPSGNSHVNNNMSVKSNDGTSNDGAKIPLEFYLADGDSFALVSNDNSAPIKYHYIVVTED